MAKRGQVRELPLLCNAEMVRAMLANRKTQTRRVIVPQPKVCPIETRPPAYPDSILWRVDKSGGILGGLLTPNEFAKCCPFGKVGDLLWVRETWWDLGYWKNKEWYGRTKYHIVKPQYYADGEPEGIIATNERATLKCQWRKRPSIFMPKWAARIWRVITKVWVEQLQDMTELDAVAEGCPPISCDEDMSEVLEWYVELWDLLYAKRGYGWDTNPWVCVREFK